MSVIITGVDMPKCCFECRKSCDKRFHVADKKTKRADDCPFKSVNGLIEFVSVKTHIRSEEHPCLVDINEVVRLIKEYCEVIE